VEDFRLAKPGMPSTSQVKIEVGASALYGGGMGVTPVKPSRVTPMQNTLQSGALSREYDEQTSVEEVNSTKLSLVEGWDDSTQYLDDDESRRLENVSSSSETGSFSDEGSEQFRDDVQTLSLPKSNGDDRGEEDPFERFRKWHARTSLPRDLVGAHDMGGDGEDASDDQTTHHLTTSEMSRSGQSGHDSLPSVVVWNPNMIPSEWLIRGRVIEAFNLPRMSNDAAGCYVCCLSLIQDLKGVAYQRYLFLDHQKGLFFSKHASDSFLGSFQSDDCFASLPLLLLGSRLR
jgi:hypothetical protein